MTGYVGIGVHPCLSPELPRKWTVKLSFRKNSPSICSKRFAFQRMIFRPSVPFDSASTCDRLAAHEQPTQNAQQGKCWENVLSKDAPIIAKPLPNKYTPYIFFLAVHKIFWVCSFRTRYFKGEPSMCLQKPDVQPLGLSLPPFLSWAVRNRLPSTYKTAELVQKSKIGRFSKHAKKKVSVLSYCPKCSYIFVSCFFVHWISCFFLDSITPYK